MELNEYLQKRHFDETPEPTGGQASLKEGLHFVVQKHEASHLHYDFRLEVNGVLKSWAIPKGPSLNPTDKRLAIQVEDHPLDYRSFEGTIPKGNYGAGTVMVWDEGIYTTSQASTKQESEQLMAQGLEDGHLRFFLNGQKLKGEFSLVRLASAKNNQWLLRKKKDEFATEQDITQLDQSVLTQRTMEEIAHTKSTLKKSTKSTRSSPAQQDLERTVAVQDILPLEEKENTFKKTKSHKDHLKQVELTHLDKIYWPQESYTKGDLITYYREVAPYLLPYLIDRPETLHRYPTGITGSAFFQKNVGHPPAWIRTEKVKHEDRTVNYILVEDEKSLLYLINLGCIEINPFTARMASLDRPDYLVLDLDPEQVKFDQVIEVAQEIHAVLNELEVESVCKTSGKTGLHIYVPLGARYTFEQSRHFGELIAHLVHDRLPLITSLERSPVKRQKKVYIDFLQNNFGQTVVAPYSVRPVPGALVSTPLKWSELKKGLDPHTFTMKNLLRRLDKVGEDLFKTTLGPGIDLEKSLNLFRNLNKIKI